MRLAGEAASGRRRGDLRIGARARALGVTQSGVAALASVLVAGVPKLAAAESSDLAQEAQVYVGHA